MTTRSKNKAAVKRYRERLSEDQRQDHLQKARAYKRRKGGKLPPPKLLLEPVSDAIQRDVLQRLRISLGAETLDECVCAVCDRWVVRHTSLEFTVCDKSSMDVMRTLLSSAGLDLPLDLIQYYDCGSIDPAFRGMLLSKKGVLAATQESVARLRMCCECSGHIKQRELPKFSIKNGFCIGELDATLIDTTLTERMMTQLVTVVALTRVMRGGAHRSIRSHCMAFDATPGPPATLLPRTLDKLSTYRVVVAGQITQAQLTKIRRVHVVRGNKVEELLRFYKRYNHFYARVEIDHDRISNACGCLIDDALIDFDENAAANLVAGVDKDQARVGAENDSDVASTPEDECELVERSLVFVNTTSTDSCNPSLVTEIPAEEQGLNSNRRFLVRNSSTFSNDDDGSIFAKMFPHLFPYGHGHPGEKRTVPVSLNACINYYGMLSSRRFAEDETFMLVAFDRLATKRMFMQISLTCKRYPNLFRGYDSITCEQLSAALRENELRQQGRIGSTTVDLSPAGRFLRSVQKGTGSLWGGSLERQRCRREAFAYQALFGQPGLFVTITPNVGNSFTMAQYTGITSVDSLFDCLESVLPSKAELRKATMGNDVASARLFSRCIDAFIEDVLALDKKTGKPKSYPGLFGPVKAYYGMVETQGGGTLHAHFIIWLLNIPKNSTEFEQLITSEETRASFMNSVVAYGASVVGNSLPLSPLVRCPECGAPADDLKPLSIPPTAYMDPKKNSQSQAPLLLYCGVCGSKLSSQMALRALLQNHRPSSWPPKVNELLPEQVLRRAETEAHCQCTVAEASNRLLHREYLRRLCDGMGDSTIVSYLPPSLLERNDLRDDKIVRLIEMLPPMWDDSRMSQHDFAFMVSTLVVLLNEHWWAHTGSCFKNSRFSSSPNTCRYSFPREPVPSTEFRKDGIELNRMPGNEYINGYNPVMMATFKSNHDIQLLIGGKDMAARIYYCCKYVTKTQNQVDSIAAVALAAFRRREEKEKVDAGTCDGKRGNIQKCRKRVAAMAYNVTNRQEISGPLAALYVQRGSCAYSSARCEKLLLYNIFAQLLGDIDYSCDLVETKRSENPPHDGSNRITYKPVASLDDYMFRPLKHDSINLYKFCMKFFRRKKTKSASKDILFLDQHPLFGSHCLGEHLGDFVPVIIGPRMPYVDLSSSNETKALRSKIALVLFKPFRQLRDLVGLDSPTEMDWINAYARWEGDRSAFDRTIMSNMDDYYSGRENAISDRKWLGTEEDTGSESDLDDSAVVDPFSDVGTDGGDYGDNGSAFYAGDWDVATTALCETTELTPVRYPSIQETPSHSKDLLFTITNTKMFLGITSRTASDYARLQEVGRCDGTSHSGYSVPQARVLRKWVKDDNTDNRLIPDAPQDYPLIHPTAVIELIRDALRPENMLWSASAEASANINDFPTLSAVSSSFTLNPLQHAAFCKIGSALLIKWLRADPSERCYQGDNFEEALSRDQLLFFLGGAGGTGKSRVIDAVTKFCSSWRRATCVLKTALTGKAATLIQGRTLASFILSLERSNLDSFVGVEMLVIDEVSMLTKKDWLKLDNLLRKYKRVSGVPFGGLHIVLVGDFLQLPPVGSDPIYIDPRTKTKYSTADIEGFLLWRRFETVIVLEESVRFRDDPEWGKGCAAARLGHWSKDFINLINSRLVKRLDSTEWSADTVFVTPDNTTRAAINNEFVKEAAKKLPAGHYPLRLVANFKNSLGGLSRSDVEYIMGLPDTRFGRMAPFLDLIEGMPIQVTQNVRPTKGVANGTLGILERVTFSADTRFRLVRDSSAGMTVRIPSRPPVFALLRLDRGPGATPFDPTAEADLFPVFYDTQSFSKTSIPLPRTLNGDTRSVPVKLQQFPFVPAVGSTIYKVQGETLHSMVVVEWKSPVGVVNKPQQTYLLVSRVVSRFAFATLEPFTASLAQWSQPPHSALREENRLLRLSANTLTSLQQANG